MADTDYISVRRLRTFLAQMKQWVLGFTANRNTQAMSDVTVNTGISGTATIGKSITIHTASGAQTASVMNSNMITNTEPSSNKDKVTKAPTYDLMENTVMTAISDAFDDITTIEYQVINNASQLPATGTNGVIYLAAIYSEVENPTGNPHDLGYFVREDESDESDDGIVTYVLTTDTSVQSGTTYYKKEDAYDEYIWLTPENRYEKLGQASIDISGLKFAGSATSGGSALQSEAIPFGSTSSTSSATAFLATVNGITELKDGTCLILKNTKVTSAAATSDPKCFTLDVNGLGAKKVYVTTAAATYATTQFTLNYKYLFVFDSSLDSGNGGWYIGQLFNTNDNTLAYNIRRSYSENKMYVGLYRYQICLTKDDDKIVPVYLPPNPTSTASSQYSTGTAKILTEETFNPWGTIWWYSTTTAVSAGSAPGASYMWDMYSLVDIRYSFNTGSTLVANRDVFMKCEPQDTGFARLHNYIVKTPTTSNPKTEGLFEKSYQSLTVSTGNPKMRGWFKKVNNEYVLAVDTSVVEGTTYYQQKFAVTTDTSVNASKTYYQKVNPITQELPTADDGFIYVRLGRAYDTYRFSMDYYKPVYYFKEGELRLWTNQTTPKYKSQYFSINPEGELDLVSGSITKSLLSSGVQASLTKSEPLIIDVNYDDTTVPSGTFASITTALANDREVYVRIDATGDGDGVTILPLIFDGTNVEQGYTFGATSDFYSSTFTIEPNNSVEYEITEFVTSADIKDELDPGGNGEIPDSAAIAAYISDRNFVEHDSTQHSNGNGTCSYADSFGSINFYSTGPITYTVAPNQKISFDSQDSTTGYIVKASGSSDGTNQAILASKANGDVEWFNDTGSSVIIRFASATNNENYSYTIVDCGYDDTIEHVYDKIGDVVQSVEITQTASGNDPGTTISVNGATPNPIVKDNEPGGSSNASVAPSWGAMKEAISDKVDKVSSTDNAVVRFNGTGGAIQNSGVTINDSNHITAVKHITSGGTSSQFVKGDGSLDSTTYMSQKLLESRGENLIYNGNGFMGDTTNFPGFTLDQSECNSSPASFKFTGNGSPICTYSIAVNPSLTYMFRIDGKQSEQTKLFYALLRSYDVDGNEILPMHYYWKEAEKTELTQDLVSGDTTIHLDNISSEWLVTGSGRKTVINFWNYTNNKGYTFPPYTYTRKSLNYGSYDAINTTLNTITLSTPYSGETIPAGTKVSRQMDGGTYLYLISGIKFGSDWETRTTLISGINTTGNGDGSSTLHRFRPGTATVKLGFLMNYSGSNSQITWITNISFSANDAGISLPLTGGTLTGGIEATSFKKTGGTSSQFLKADGSVDSTAYGTYSKPSGGIPKTDLASAVQTSLGKADTALQSHQDISGKVDYADGTKTTTTKQMGTTAVTIDGISMYTSESTTYTIQNGYTISIDAQGTSMGYIYQNSNSTILAQDPSGDVEWTNTTGESVVVKIGSATSGENYSITIFKKGYYTTIDELTEKIEEAAASGVQADWDESDADDPAYIKNKPTVYTKPLSGIPKSDLANAVQTSLGKADSAVQSVTISQSSAVGTGGTTIQVDNGSTYQLVSDGEPQGSDNGYVAPTWGAMNTLLDGKVDKVSGKGLSTNDYTTEEKTKLGGISEGAEANVQSNWNETDNSSDAFIQNKPTIPTALADLTEDSSHKVVSQASITTWNDKAEKVTQVNHGTSDTTYTLTPNVLHVWGEVTALTLTLGTGESGVVNEYMFQFYSGNTPTTLTLPNSVIWVQPLTTQAGKTYQVSIVNNLACYITDGMVAAESSGGTPTYATQAWVTSLIDAAPTANSSNVPTSGGTYEMIEGGYYYN